MFTSLRDHNAPTRTERWCALTLWVPIVFSGARDQSPTTKDLGQNLAVLGILSLATAVLSFATGVVNRDPLWFLGLPAGIGVYVLLGIVYHFCLYKIYQTGFFAK